MTSSTSRLDLCSIHDVLPGDAIKVTAGGLDLAVYNVDGDFFVTEDACSHGPGSLSDGFLEGFVIECNIHNGGFDVRTGEAVMPPCIESIATYTVTIDNDRVTIER